MRFYDEIPDAIGGYIARWEAKRDCSARNGMICPELFIVIGDADTGTGAVLGSLLRARWNGNTKADVLEISGVTSARAEKLVSAALGKIMNAEGGRAGLYTSIVVDCCSENRDLLFEVARTPRRVLSPLFTKRRDNLYLLFDDTLYGPEMYAFFRRVHAAVRTCFDHVYLIGSQNEAEQIGRSRIAGQVELVAVAAFLENSKGIDAGRGPGERYSAVGFAGYGADRLTAVELCFAGFLRATISGFRRADRGRVSACATSAFEYLRECAEAAIKSAVSAMPPLSALYPAEAEGKDVVVRLFDEYYLKPAQRELKSGFPLGKAGKGRNAGPARGVPLPVDCREYLSGLGARVDEICESAAEKYALPEKYAPGRTSLLDRTPDGVYARIALAEETARHRYNGALHAIAGEAAGAIRAELDGCGKAWNEFIGRLNEIDAAAKVCLESRLCPAFPEIRRHYLDLGMEAAFKACLNIDMPDPLDCETELLRTFFGVFSKYCGPDALFKPMIFEPDADTIYEYLRKNVKLQVNRVEYDEPAPVFHRVDGCGVAVLSHCVNLGTVRFISNCRKNASERGSTGGVFPDIDTIE